MVKLTEDMKEAFSKVQIFPFATASKAGIPNVIPIGMCKLVDDETIWVTDNYFLKTRQNLDENPVASIFVWGPEVGGCFQIKGDVEIKTSGDDYDKAHAGAKAKGDKFPAKALMVMKITDVFECKSGDDAGKKLV
ncbi:pyridoxamine 5'-phosphate oxidase family protein [Methanococcoides sp.]|uniref:pyridoxamine 5'-phosphate oxidase family protein n=1 Tax=Methanococcoides sp. TaxID=1966350 RepID=UPI0019EE3FDA|nr:pyridoxamine 5'-phosphate oxidase family protein [Methanococcoides sp.]NOQ48559.1 pyridoxamine 5-phosphate oxidase [Methanococcoides sp.]